MNNGKFKPFGKKNHNLFGNLGRKIFNLSLERGDSKVSKNTIQSNKICKTPACAA